ncbi:MAG: tryptophan synthase subunit alpha [Ghiorsea sp.]
MNMRLSRVFSRCKQEDRAALVGYLTAGDPNVVTSEKLMLALAAQVDIVEIGMPFSDPAADGPVIQAASERALEAGTHITDVFNIALKIRQDHPEIGIVLMGYANVPYTLGFDTFAEQAENAGVDGVLLVDIPAEEMSICSEAFEKHHLSQIMLLAPTSTEERIKLAAEVGHGFIYYVSLAGITGAEMGEVDKIKDKLSLIRQYSKLPLCVGFGVKTTQQASDVAAFADGVVVGSHFVSQITSNIGDEYAMIANLSKSASALSSSMLKSSGE